MAVSANTAREVKAGGAYVELSTTDAKLRQGLTNAQNRLKKFSADIGALGSTLFKMGGGIVAPLGLAANQYANLSDKLLVVRARTKASDDEFASMRQRVNELTRTTTFSATEIADGMIALASMGMSPQQINGLIESMLNLSRATGTELAQATTIAMNNLNVFNASVNEAENYVDILSKTSNGSAQILSDLGEALSMSGLSAKNAGVDFESLNAILAVLANNGQRGTMAGTGMRNVFLSFVKNAEKFKEYGIELEDESHNLRSIPDIFDDISRKIQNMPTMEKQEMFSNLFGTRGLNSAAILANNTAALREFMDELRGASGDARTTSLLQDSDIGGAKRRMLNSLKGLSSAVGEAIANAITPMAQNISTVINNTTDWIKRNADAVVSVGKLGVSLMATGATLIALSKTLNLVSMGFGAARTALVLTGNAVAILSNPLNALIVTLGAVTVATLGATDFFKNSFNSAFETVGRNYESFKYVILNGKLEDAFKIVGLTIKSIWADVMEYLFTSWKAVENMIAQAGKYVWKLFYWDMDLDTISKQIDDMTANDVLDFRTAKTNYQQQINDLVNGVKTAAEVKNENNAENVNDNTALSKANDLIESLGKIPSVTAETTRKINNPTFGSYNLEAINLGMPTFQVDEKMLNELKKIEKNTRDITNDDDDGVIELY